MYLVIFALHLLYVLCKHYSFGRCISFSQMSVNSMQDLINIKLKDHTFDFMLIHSNNKLHWVLLLCETFLLFGLFSNLQPSFKLCNLFKFCPERLTKFELKSNQAKRKPLLVMLGYKRRFAPMWK